MRAHRVFDQTVPTPEEIQAVIRRAHYERSQAFRRILGALFWRRKTSVVEPDHAPGVSAAGCR